MNSIHKNRKKGFTLLEIILVIAAIGILAAIVLVAINPNRQLAQVRNAERRSEINTIYKSLEQYLIDKGSYPAGITTAIQDICINGNTTNCVNLGVLVPDYIAAIPTDPVGGGYKVGINAVNNRVSVYAINAELGSAIAINNGLWTPAQLSGLSLWLDAADASTITLNGSTVSQWNDKSGNGRHVSQGTATRQPGFSANGLSFDATDDSLSASSVDFSATDKLTVVMALKNVKADSTRHAFVFGNNMFAGSRGFELSVPFSNQNTIRVAARGTSLVQAVSANGSVPPNTDAIYSFGADIAGDSVFGFFNGTQVCSNTADLGTGNFGTAPLAIGAYSPPTGGYFGGSIYEVIVYSTILSTFDRQTLEGYLAWKWGLVSNLPADHPYKNIVP